jgi:hypothetical protein
MFGKRFRELTHFMHLHGFVNFTIFIQAQADWGYASSLTCTRVEE